MEYYFGDGNSVVAYSDNTVGVYKYSTPRKLMRVDNIKELSRLLSRLEKLFHSQRN